jgi:hypothetical protein
VNSSANQNKYRDLINFLLVVIVAIGAKYYAPPLISTLVFTSFLVAYYRSGNEPFWLAFFLVTADGVFSFLGRFEATLTIIPGLPEVEISQLYILLSFLKARTKEVQYRPFYHTLLIIAGIYILFLIAQGFTVGLTADLKIVFRVIKEVLPFLLFYSIPVLMKEERHYRQLFLYLFPVAILAFGAQFVTILFKTSPLQLFGAKIETRPKILINLNVTAEHAYRGIYNECILIITYFGALYYLAARHIRINIYYLYLIILCIFLAYFISATRGYTFGFLIVFVLFLLFIVKFTIKRFILAGGLATLALIGLLSIPLIKIQFEHSFKRMETMLSLAEGDLTAGGTLVRISERGPKVMRKWAESPLTGWGFSDTFMEYGDMHTGNQTLLLHSGILGALLMGSFFVFFCSCLIFRSFQLPREHRYKYSLLVFPIFLVGWFFIHTSTQYYFTYAITPDIGFIQAIFFSMGALVYQNSLSQSLEQQGSEVDPSGIYT